MKTIWEAKFEGKITPMIIHADTFIEAVEEARKISDKIVYVKYVAY
jgi:hypothetical protein